MIFLLEESISYVGDRVEHPWVPWYPRHAPAQEFFLPLNAFQVVAKSDRVAAEWQNDAPEKRSISKNGAANEASTGAAETSVSISICAYVPCSDLGSFRHDR